MWYLLSKKQEWYVRLHHHHGDYLHHHNNTTTTTNNKNSSNGSLIFLKKMCCKYIITIQQQKYLMQTHSYTHSLNTLSLILILEFISDKNPTSVQILRYFILQIFIPKIFPPVWLWTHSWRSKVASLDTLGLDI